MRKYILIAAFILFPMSLLGQEMIERLEIEGNDRVSKETILYYVAAREGDYYNPGILRNDFQTLWSTGFFSNIRIEKEEGQNGKIVRFIIEENPIIKKIEYKTGKKLKESDIVEKLKENNEYILAHSYYNPYKILKVKNTIEKLLLERGLQSGEVNVDLKGDKDLELVFDIEEGHKTKVGEIVFEGNTKIPEAVLEGAMKENQEHGLITLIRGKDVFKRDKLDEGLEQLKSKLQEYGYMEASIGEPRIENVEKRSIFLKKQTMKKIIIPVDPGYRYIVGDITIEGNKIIASKYLKTLVEFEKGDIYSTKLREESVQAIAEVYRDLGYIYIQVMPRENLDPKNKRVNVSFNIYEGDVAYIQRIKIRGNIYTKDKVLRRELILREGDRFSFSFFKNSLLRLNQLGLVELEGDPDIQPDPEDPTQIDVTLRVKELQRNNIQFTAGYSGYEGLFVGASYSTVNFLGAGEKLDVMLQHGKRIKNYVFGFSEPYVFDKPINLGFNLYRRHMIYPYLYERKETGIDLIFGARIFGYWRTNVTYTYAKVTTILPEEGSSYFSYYDPVYLTMFGLGTYNISSITPVIYRSTVDSPLTPSRGTMYMASLKFAGTFLGGEIDILKPTLEFTHYQPIIKNQSFGFHVQYQYIHALGDSDVPFWERFYLGGERSIRGYNIYTIGPRSEAGSNVGGDKALLFNLEYIIPMGGPLYAILFYDRGNAYAADQKISLKDMYSSAGLEMRIFVPALRVPFRLIFAYNSPKIYADDSNFAFRFAIGTTF
ncbi:MAG: outer membrane protein assembly factor BamA [Candidatus Aminicenantes bacterium]|nr:outer membrane protein assembly factor BamA [Candidatus Aminicenantes bacterium]